MARYKFRCIWIRTYVAYNCFWLRNYVGWFMQCILSPLEVDMLINWLALAAMALALFWLALAAMALALFFKS